MIIIRPEQYQALADAQNAQILAACVAAVRADFPVEAEVFGDEDLRSRAAAVIARARGAGITDPDVLCRAVLADFAALRRASDGPPLRAKSFSG